MDLLILKNKDRSELCSVHCTVQEEGSYFFAASGLAQSGCYQEGKGWQGDSIEVGRVQTVL